MALDSDHYLDSFSAAVQVVCHNAQRRVAGGPNGRIDGQIGHNGFEEDDR